MAEYSKINGQFQNLLGREVSQDEFGYFQKLIDSGQLDVHEIGQILQSHPEYQNKQLNADTEAYGAKLAAGDNQILQQGADVAGAQAQSRFASLGRPNSSAMAAQVYGQTGQIAQGLAQRRQGALADFYGKGLQNNAALGAQNGQGALARSYFTQDRAHQEAQDQYWYNRQGNDYQNAKNAAGGWNAITPEFVGSGLFSIAGKAAAAKTGGMAGGGGAPRGGGEYGQYPSTMGPSWNGGR